MNAYMSSLKVIPENTQKATKKISRRELIIDILRGFAVALMVITHVIALTYSGGPGNDPIVYNIGQIGGIASFTLFLFISGFSIYYSFLRTREDDLEEEYLPRERHKLLSRVIKILVVYYLLAIASVFTNTTLFSFPPSITWGENLVLTLFFQIIPEFTEFLLALTLFLASVLLFRKFYILLIKRPYLALIFSVIFYILGTVISKIDLGSTELNSIKAIFGGHIFDGGQLHTFPIFQYFFIFIMGMFLGRFFFYNPNKGKRIALSFMWFASFALLAFSGFVANRYFNTNILYPLPDEGRFPPSLTFIALSLSIAMLVLCFFLILNRLIPKFVKVSLHYLGVNALEVLFFHTLLLFAYKYFTTNDVNPSGIKHISLIDEVMIFIVALLISTVLISIKNAAKKWATYNGESDGTWWFFTERAISTLVLVVIFSIFVTTVYKDVFVKSTIADTSDIQFKKRLIREEDPWWNHEFRTFRQINITNNNPAFPLFIGSWVSVKFNHNEAVRKGSASYSNGGDVRVIYSNKDAGEYIEVPIIIENPNSDATTIAFKLQNNINPGDTSLDYSIYYGNDAARESLQSKDKYSNPPQTDGVTIENEKFHSITTSINRKWFLKKKAAAYQAAALLFEAKIEDSEISDSSIVTYTINGTNKNGTMKSLGDRKFQAAAIVSDLEPGVYTIQANVTDSKNNLKIFRSQKVAFYVTYPIYVNWSQDWEGWDVGQGDLDEIASISDTYQIPITHYFNPRIYVSKQYTINPISPDRAKYLTDWIKDRQKNRFDEIGMHIHMWGDMVAEAGVNPRNAPIIQGTYNVDVPSYAYTQDELEKVFDWGKRKLIQNELGSPISYRTGAWMSGPNVLKAAQNTGFLIDSSGRTSGPVNSGIPSSTPVPWDLSTTTRPYRPNQNDINKWDANINDRLNIWEFPNNGADSYWFSTNELIKRFDANYPVKGSIMKYPQVVTYLSHPHWFVAYDKWKIRGLLDHTNQFLYKNDAGPVVYATLETIYSEWDKEKFNTGD